MSRNESQIGELFMLGLDNEQLGLIKNFHDAFGLGGVILFARNFESVHDIRELISEVISLTSNDLIIAVDQEGGGVVRISGSEFPVFPSAASYGSRGDLKGAIHAAEVTARCLLDLGINMNLAPVADVLTNPANDLMRTRCYSSDTAAVSDYVRAMVGAYNRSGVASCAKHFPGLGDSVIDPHVRLAVSNRLEAFCSEKMYPPFRVAIEESCPAIMTTHLKVRSLDSDNPATYSRSIVTEILRNSLGFSGVILTDDLDMGAIDDLDDAVPMALTAGHDMVLICHSFDKQISCAERVQALVASGELDGVVIERKIERVRNLKQTFKN
ncbi:MAG: hypothetical protein KKH67_10330 [candidate division Zixibacteria bacterium]|nr:hypothetical protein [candidate division Zixibacteria bacterium]MBU1470868.1 hypothetical protein [candidate division Zixibacteria bacterium]